MIVKFARVCVFLVEFLLFDDWRGPNLSVRTKKKRKEEEKQREKSIESNSRGKYIYIYTYVVYGR